MKRYLDFDGTVYSGDSGKDFVTYMLKQEPLLVSKSLIKSSIFFALYKLNLISIEDVKNNVFSFIKEIKDIDKYVDDYVNNYTHDVMDWYKKERQNDDIFVSAGLDLYLIKLTKKLGIKNLICTRIDKTTGKIIGNNVSGKEKYEKIKNECSKYIAYGNSEGDAYLLEYAEEAYFITKQEEKIKYNYQYRKKIKKSNK